MTVRNSLLAILTMGPCYGSQLKAEFERRTDGVWPLNVGQVYTTLGRLVRDGLVRRRDMDEAGRERFELTDAGRQAVDDWYRSPAPLASAQRDEFVMKVVLALTLPGVDTAAMLQAQRAAARDALDCPPAELPLGARLVMAAQREQLLAQVRWIDHVSSVPTPTPWGLDAELPKRGRPHKAPAGAA